MKVGISTGTGRVQTVKDVADCTWRAFNNREELSEDVFYSAKKKLVVNDTVSLFLKHRVSFQVNATKKKPNSLGTEMVKKSNACFSAAQTCSNR